MHMAHTDDHALVIQVSDIERDERLEHPEAIARRPLLLVLEQHAGVLRELLPAHQAFLSGGIITGHFQGDREATCAAHKAGFSLRKLNGFSRIHCTASGKYQSTGRNEGRQPGFHERSRYPVLNIHQMVVRQSPRNMRVMPTLTPMCTSDTP